MALKAKTVTVEGVEYGVLQGGKPVYMDDVSGEESAYDVEQMRNKIGELNTESKSHRLSAKEMKDKVDRFGDADPDEVTAFRTTLAELGGPDGIAKLKATAKVDVEAVKKSVADAYEIRLAEANTKVETLSARERQLLIGNGFASSQFLKETTHTPSKAEMIYGHHFRVEDGKPVGYINGNPILTKDGTGNIASFEEAFKVIFQNDPERDLYTKSTVASGTGASQSNGRGGSAAINPNMSAVERITAARAAGQKT